METKNILYTLRTERGLSQDELAEKVFVTRQAVSRWENGETTPGVETLKILSKFFNVSIIRCWVRRSSWSASAAECRWRMIPPAESRTAHSMRSIANGVTPTGSSGTPARSS